MENKKDKKAYVAGKISGRDYDEAKREFDGLALKLRQQGYAVFNPTEIVPADADWQEAMKVCIAELMLCDEAYFLPGSRYSKGARLEHDLCTVLGIEVHYVKAEK